jgi:hypothetical protein
MEVVELKLVVEEVVVDVFDLGNDCSGILETVFGHGERWYLAVGVLGKGAAAPADEDLVVAGQWVEALVVGVCSLSVRTDVTAEAGLVDSGSLLSDGCSQMQVEEVLGGLATVVGHPIEDLVGR